MATKKEHEIANRIIREMAEAGLSYDQMLKVIKMAREKLKAMRSSKQ